MNLLVIFLISVLIGQSLSIGLGLLVEGYSTPYIRLMIFIGSYFVMFWLAWRRSASAHRGRRNAAG